MSHDEKFPPREPRAFDLGWLLLGQWWFSGRSPKAPGTVGSLATLPFFWLFKEQSSLFYWAATLFICGFGFVVAEECSQILGEKDPQSVVIDEVAGVLLAMGAVANAAPWSWALAFVLFRLFDITKPGVINKAQYWGTAGVGIMADDLIAGVLAGSLAAGAVYLSSM